jgi:hypothetical protein
MVDNTTKDLDVDSIIDKLLEVRGYVAPSFPNNWSWIINIEAGSLLTFRLDLAQASRLTWLSKRCAVSALSQETFS